MLEPRVADTLALVASGAAALALLLALVLWLKLRRLVRASELLQAGDDGQSFVEIVARKVREVEGLRGEISALGRRLDTVREELGDALRHVAVVRYDAFRDMGGRLSFSAAMLDDKGTGVVLSSIHGRSETRVYLKGVVRGQAEQISPEEQQAISHALSGGPTTSP